MFFYMKFRIWETALLVLVAGFLLFGSVAQATAEGLSGDFLRLHVIANSDSAYDQELKLLVRDEILAYSEEILVPGLGLAACETVLTERLDELEGLAAQVLRENGCELAVAASLTDAHFPTKHYGGFSLPAGNYRALRIVIGEGGGENWWCVVFPPLCFGAVTETVTAEQAMAYGVDARNAGLIAGENEGYVLRFKCLELWDSIVN